MQSTQSCQWISFKSFFCASHCFYLSGLRLQVVSKQRDDNLKTEQELRSLKAECDSSMAEAKRVCVFVFVHFFFHQLCVTTSCPAYVWSTAQRGPWAGQADSQRRSWGNEKGGVKADQRAARARPRCHQSERLLVQHRAAASRWGGAIREEVCWAQSELIQFNAAPVHKNSDYVGKDFAEFLLERKLEWSDEPLWAAIPLKMEITGLSDWQPSKAP